jgi:hypothetical protein
MDAELPIDEIKSFAKRDWIANPDLSLEPNPIVEGFFEKYDDIRDIILKENCHLQELLFNGVTIDSFLDNGFDWNDLKQFKDLSEPNLRRIEALFALKVTAEDFLRHPTKLPYKEMGITPDNMIFDFGLHFPENAPLTCLHGRNDIDWSMDDLRSLGWEMKDLLSAGLKTRRQLEALGATQKELDQMFPPQPQQQEFRRRGPKAVEKYRFEEPNEVKIRRPRHGLKKRK